MALTPARVGAYNPRVLRHRTIADGAQAAALCLALAAGAALTGGCEGADWLEPSLTSDPPLLDNVPEPIDRLLPSQIRLQAFTGTRVFSEHGGIAGIDVRIECRDHFGDACKAFGRFRFELFHHRPNSRDPKGERIAVWNQDTMDPERNRRHWDRYMQTYRFKLGWHRPVPVGRKYVLLATFDSPFTNRLTDERVFVAGQ